MKELKDYIHFYMGCECVNLFFPTSHPEYRKGWILTGVTFDNLAKPYKLETATDYTWTNEIKPILRRLDSMTEDVIFNLFSFDGDLSEAKLTRASIQGNFMQCEYIIHGAIASVWMHASRFLPSQFQYLLSLGFDMFGLIDAGIAIEKTNPSPDLVNPLLNE